MNTNGRFFPLISGRSLALSALVMACVAIATAGSTSISWIAHQSKAISIGVLRFHNESGVDAPAWLAQRLAQQLRQRLNTSYNDIVARALEAGSDSPGTVSVEHLVALARQSGMRAIIRGGILALDSETAADETRVSVQLYADVILAESGKVNTVRAEGTGQQKGTGYDALRTDAEALVSSEFSSSALGLALSNAVEQLTGLVYQSVNAQVPQSVTASDPEAQPLASQPDDQDDAAISSDEDLKQLIAQAEVLLTKPDGVSSDSAVSLDRAVRALKEALAAKEKLLKKAKDTSQVDLEVAARKEELQALLNRLTTEAASAQESPGTVDAQPPDQKKSTLARISEYLGETVNILQKIQELRAAFRSADEDPSQYGGVAVPSGNEAFPTKEESTGDIDGVVTESGIPVEGMTITDVEAGASATTDGSGSYTLKGVLAGKLAKVLLAKQGKQVGSGQVEVPRGRAAVADFELSGAVGRGVACITPSSVVVTSGRLGAGIKSQRLQGVVEDGRGKPVARALVHLKGLGVARTDSQGRYTFFNVPVGAQQLIIKAAGLRSVSEQVQVSAVDNAKHRIKLDRITDTPVREALILRGAGTSLRGVIRDYDNRVLGGAKVTVLQGVQSLSVVAGPQGAFELRDLKPAIYRVVISKVGFESWSQTLDMRGGRVELSEVRLRKNAELSDPLEARRVRQGEIRGQVRWSSGGPVAGAQVELRPTDKPFPVLRTVASSKGEYSIKLVEGFYEVKVKQGAQAVSKVIVVHAGSTSREDFALRAPGVTTTDSDASERLPVTSQHTAPVQQSAMIVGQVIDARTGMPVRGALVSLEGRSIRRSVRTDQRGGYSFGELRPDRYRVRAGSASFSSEEKDVVARAAVSTRQDFALKPEMKADNRTDIGGTRSPGLAVEVKRGQISGRVIDSRTGRPVAGAMVVVAGQRPVLTDSQGGFLVSGLATGSHRIGVTMRGYGGVQGSVSVRSGETTAANFRLSPNPSPPVRRP